MKRKHKRLLFVLASFCAAGCALLFILSELRESVSFFYTTSELLSGPQRESNLPVRVGGMVVKGSVARSTDSISFNLTDFKTELNVVYSGMLPPLFGEGVGAVVKGRLLHGKFVADEVLAKHDEKYMPKKYNAPKALPEPK
ncbi:cytochrome c maturation protein CcmE [Anaplasma marginale]|uniref:cytochrome c maturation protein CcmE n=1 Tax=Anaplasma marginale TaxID=770 RepID=UPI0012442CED|nr:cytochrome c maturation protein CcmE [Anaplasma marginale]KAB0453360.1 cytochrome c maturation protein CcmE [Anaplasma marginale]